MSGRRGDPTRGGVTHTSDHFASFDQNALRRWLAGRVESVQARTWHEIGERLARMGYWEFEDYRA
ncbi:Imm8 family immunity protein [Phycicoccus sp. Soil803]|uniref:Imm8 family immunity protein n=1 Tax=Phycicoccus sp. Soil803 TaxID=1736415 RepID=UPI000AB257DF